MYNPYAGRRLEKLLAKLRKKKTHSSDFEFRLVMLFQELHSQFMKIYGQHPRAEAKLFRLASMLSEYYSKRPGDLKVSDRYREKNPKWFLDHDLTGMMLYVDRFAGNLEGLENRLSYFDELKINVLHLMPMLWTPEGASDGGYAVSNYRKIDPRFGSNKDLLRLASTMRQKGMFLMMDLVVNHTSDKHQWAIKARSGEEKYQDYYYTFEDRTIPDLFEQSLPEVFPENSPGNFTWDEDMEKWVMTVFHSYQWDLNYTNPDVFHEMMEILMMQSNWGIDIFRLDAVAFLWKKLGTTSQNLPMAHEILRLFKICTKIAAPGVVFVAEAIVEPHEIVKYFGKSEVWSNECDIAYNASLMAMLWDAVATRKNTILYHAIDDIPDKPTGTSWINYLRCHDDIGLGYDNRYIEWAGFTPQPHRKFIVDFYSGLFPGSFARGLPFMINPRTNDTRISGSLASLAGLEAAYDIKDDDRIDLAIRRILMLHGVILAWEGLPMLYYGDELATLNDYSFKDHSSLMDDNRWVHRPKIDWERAEERRDPGSDIARIFQGIKHFIEVRKKLPVLNDDGDIRLIDPNNLHVLAFLRSGPGKLLVMANLTENEEVVSSAILHGVRMEQHRLIDVLSGSPPQYDELGFILSPYQVIWLAEAGTSEKEA